MKKTALAGGTGRVVAHVLPFVKAVHQVEFGTGDAAAAEIAQQLADERGLSVTTWPVKNDVVSAVKGVEHCPRDLDAIKERTAADPSAILEGVFMRDIITNLFRSEYCKVE